MDCALNGLGGLVIQDVELGLESMGGKDAVELLVGSEGFGVTAVFHWFHEDAITVVVVED